MGVRNLLIIIFSLSIATVTAKQKRHLLYRSTKKNLEKTNANSYNGFFSFEYQESNDKILLKVSELDKEFLYVNSLSEGIGSNDIGLDRGQLGRRRIVKFQKAGDKLLLVQPNYKYRATTKNTLEKKSVTQAFAKSVLFGFPIEKKTKNEYWIDLTPFLKLDAHGVAKRLKDTKQGTYIVDSSRTALYLERTRAFPKNVEFEVLLTFTGTPEGEWIRSVTPSAEAVTVHQHHSFIELPDNEYEPRKFDPRAGVNALRYYDYATPVEEATLQEWIVRHRLRKKDPKAELSEAVEPIVYYLDNGTPEPVRSALLEGGRWWNEAFETIGFKDAFQVKVLPDTVDPMDIRYNVIQWVHRSTRGWSYGSSVVDPRTGEIIKGQVSLGSLRIRQDYMIALGLTETPFVGEQSKPEILEMALARIRQLSAHEIGHTLGFAHNFAASTKDRASVMDYPHPTLQLIDGKISYANAYDTGIGEWDKVSVAYAYSDFSAETNKTLALREILESSEKLGLPFITDQDARPLGGAHPSAHLWDNGSSPIEELNNLLEIRKVALNQMDLNHLKEGETYTQLEDRLVPIYLLHRYQVEAVSKLIGGLSYEYGVKGAKIYTTSFLDAAIQRNALSSFLKSLYPKTLLLPKKFLSILPPRSFGNPRGRESFKSQTGVAFDHLSLAETLTSMQLKMLLHPERINRLIQQTTFDPSQLGFEEVLTALYENIFEFTAANNAEKNILIILKDEIVNQLIELYLNKKIFPQVASQIIVFFNRLELIAGAESATDFDRYLQHKIQLLYTQPNTFKTHYTPKIPDGSPIGSFQCDFVY